MGVCRENHWICPVTVLGIFGLVNSESVSVHALLPPV